MISLVLAVAVGSTLTACDGDALTTDEPSEAVGVASQELTIDRDISTWTGDQFFPGTTCGAGNDYTPSCVGSSTAEDYAFLWTPPTTGTYVFSTIGSSFDTVIHLRDGAGGPSIACNDDSFGGLQSVVGANVTAGHPITVVVDGYGASCGNYVLSIKPVSLPSAGTLALWLAGDYLANIYGSSGSSMPSWFDQSGNENHATAGPARQPQIFFNTVNGRPIVRFSGAQSFDITRPLNSRPFTFFIVGKNSMPTETFSMILGPSGSSANNQLRWENGSQSLLVGTGNGMPVVTANTGNTRVFHALSGRYDGSTLNVYRDGNLVSTSTFSTSGPWTLSQIGAYYSSYFMQGDVAEIIFYANVLSDADRSTVNAYLRSKYALP